MSHERKYQVQSKRPVWQKVAIFVLLLALADGHGTHVEVDGVIWIVRYFTLCGAVDIERWTDREMGVRNGPTLVPLDLDAGLVERTTPALGVRIALGRSQAQLRDARFDSNHTTLASIWSMEEDARPTHARSQPR